MMKRFFLGLVLFFSISFSFAGSAKVCDTDPISGLPTRCSCFKDDKPTPCSFCFYTTCHTINGGGCFNTYEAACNSIGLHFWRPEFVDSNNLTFSCREGIGRGETGPIGKVEQNVFYCADPPPDWDEDPCGNGKDPETCDMDDPPPDDPDDPCGNGKDPATCDMDDPPPDNPPDDDNCDPSKGCYDDDYDPDKPPCKIMVNGKCVYDDDDRKYKICSNGQCKCFDKRDNGTLKEVPCNDSGSANGDDDNDHPFYDEACDDPTDITTCGDLYKDDDYNPNDAHDDFEYDFGDLDPKTDLPDPKDLKDTPKEKEVDLSGWGVNDYFNSSGYCPSPTTVSLGTFGTLEVSYQYFCDICRIIRTVVIAFAWLSGLLIITRINKQE